VPVEALFTSLSGGAELRARVLATLREVEALPAHTRIDVHIMTFAFTDAAVADLLRDIAAAREDLSVRVLADWGQGSPGSGRVLRRLVQAGLPNLSVRYKHDQPYVHDAGTGRIRWSYHASRGLLHHKTLEVLVDGVPTVLVCGSFNWTGAAARGYENLLVVQAGDDRAAMLLDAVQREFAALWSDGAASLSPAEAVAHHAAVLAEFQTRPDLSPADARGIGIGAGAVLPAGRPAEVAVTADVGAEIAFSSRSPGDTTAANGYAGENRIRRLDLRKPGGTVKSVPMTLTSLALDTIVAAAPGDRLLMAMYGLSARVPEYGALLDAARRGVRVSVLLDGTVGGPQVSRLAGAIAREHLPIRVRAGTRTMHQKYLLHPESATVLTGTANMSTDATRRHTEHRIRFRGDERLTEAFLADFETIWARLPSPFRAGSEDSSGPSDGALRGIDTAYHQA